MHDGNSGEIEKGTEHVDSLKLQRERKGISTYGHNTTSESRITHLFFSVSENHYQFLTSTFFSRAEGIPKRRRKFYV